MHRLLLNNDYQGMVRQWQDLFYKERHMATPMTNPDFVKLAEAMHVKASQLKNQSKWEKKEEWDGGSAGKVITKGKRGKGFV